MKRLFSDSSAIAIGSGLALRRSTRRGTFMKQMCDVKTEMELGRLMWIQPPALGSAEFFARKFLNGLGFKDRELVYVTANQFLRYFKDGFTLEFLKNTRVLLIGEIENIGEKSQKNLLLTLSRHRVLKKRCNLNLVLISPLRDGLRRCIQARFKPGEVSIFGDRHPIGINERIHEHLENASAHHSKTVWSLSEEAAGFLEAAYLNIGDHYVKSIIYDAVEVLETKTLTKIEINKARQKLNSGQPKSRF